jgi:hypothetical protein
MMIVPGYVLLIFLYTKNNSHLHPKAVCLSPSRMQVLSSLVWCLSFLQRLSEESVFLLLSLFGYIYSLFILKRVHGFLLCQVCGFHQDFGINRDKCLAMHISGSKQQQLGKSVWQMWPKTLAQAIHCL